MDAEFKAKWTTALRGGEYQQVAGYLCAAKEDRNAFCCIGVALDIKGAAWVSPPTTYPAVMRDCAINGKIFKSNSLSGEIAPALPMLERPSIDHLMGLNDSGKSFEEIADYIDKYL